MEGLYILPFDHRSSFMKMILAASPKAGSAISRARECKRVIYDAFRKSVEEGVSRKKAAILVDWLLGKQILADARSRGFVTCVSLEKSGKDEFQFERKGWKKMLKELGPVYAKVLVRYNPEGDKKINGRQAERIAGLGSYLSRNGIKLLFELLVPATGKQLMVAGSMKSYDERIRPHLMVAAIRQLQEAGVNPDVWKLEGTGSVELMRKVAGQVKSGNPKARIVILGRGESVAKAKLWLKAGAEVSSVVGFAVGRSVFKKPIESYVSGRISREKAVKKISENYRLFVDFWEKVKR